MALVVGEERLARSIMGRGRSLGMDDPFWCVCLVLI